MRSLIKASSFILILTMLLVSIGCAKISDDPYGSDSGSYSNSEYSSDASLNSNGTTDASTSKATTKKETTKTETAKTEASQTEATVAKKTFTLNTTNKWKYSQDASNNVTVRTLNITTGWGGESVTIGQASDLHINYCTSNDLKDPVLYSTYQNRNWLKNGASLPHVQRCMQTLSKSDLVVITGDLYDYYSEGVVIKTHEYVFSKYNNVVACLGNHEFERQMQGTVADSKTLSERRFLVQASWCNDIDYASYVVKDKVMAVLLDNSTGNFLESQYEKFKADLETARNNGYVVLIFYHIPLDTGNPECARVEPIYKNSGETAYLYGTSYIGPSSTGTSKKIYDLICNNGDVIKGCFSGHYHSDYYTEILAKTPDGTSTIIPQYILTGGAYDQGNVLKIVVT